MLFGYGIEVANKPSYKMIDFEMCIFYINYFQDYINNGDMNNLYQDIDSIVYYLEYLQNNCCFYIISLG